MNFVAFQDSQGREILVASEHVETIENAAGGIESIIHLKSGRKIIVMGRSAEIVCRLKGGC